MDPLVKNKSPGHRTPKRKRQEGDKSIVMARKRKSIRLQHSISLHIPMEELSGSTFQMNCYIDLGNQVFSLTYLDMNDTQNPESLKALTELTKKNWQAYFVSTLYNFDYNPNQMRSLSKALKNALTTKFQNCRQVMRFDTEVVTAEYFNPTENDKQALKITVFGVEDEKEIFLYEGYLISWCNPEKDSGVLLPILLCTGKKKYQTVIHAILSDKLDTRVQKMLLTQEEFLHLSTYCLIMLDENDGFTVKLSYSIPVGTIHVETSLEKLLKLWKKIHKDESIEVELDEVILFNQAFEHFIESSMGLTLGHTSFQSVNVKGCFSLHRHAQMKFNSTKITHVVLKYLSYLAVRRLKIKALSAMEGVKED